MISALEMFSIGIGPSSSHTVGPMRAAKAFARAVVHERPQRIEVRLLGSLGATGPGHGTDTAVILGLSGEDPATVDVDRVAAMLTEVVASGRLLLDGVWPVSFRPAEIQHHPEIHPPEHPNTMEFTAFDGADEVCGRQRWCSIGGGFITGADDGVAAGGSMPGDDDVPHPFTTAQELLVACESTGTSIAELVRANELVRHTQQALDAGLDRVWEVMTACIDRGLRTPGVLPGGLRVARRAPDVHAALLRRGSNVRTDPVEWLTVYALAVSEENAAGGRVVTAPTNGAAGILPAALHRHLQAHPPADSQATARLVRTFLLTATAIGWLIKTNASISGAEVGCQGEVGSACAMAAAGLAAIQGGSPTQVENAAEIGLEHHLGLTCDPVGGLVQIPCIERNAFGAVMASQAAALALHGDGRHLVSLDQAVEALRRTGEDMSHRYKETALGGLALSVVDC